LVIIGGMSQMYAINDAQPHDNTISEQMDDSLSQSEPRVRDVGTQVDVVLSAHGNLPH
jgi:hypothetical protein